MVDFCELLWKYLLTNYWNDIYIKFLTEQKKREGC